MSPTNKTVSVIRLLIGLQKGPVNVDHYMKEEGIHCRRTLQRYVGDLRESGVSVIYTGRGETLSMVSCPGQEDLVDDGPASQVASLRQAVGELQAALSAAAGRP